MKLEFAERGFDAIVALNGAPADVTLLKDLAGLPLIAADGAANMLVALGVLPEFIVGDMDSVTDETLQATEGVSEVIVIPEQETTDFEKVLTFAEDHLWKNLLILGIHGGDFEHTLNNWSVLMRQGQRLNLTALDRSRYAIPVYHGITADFHLNELISIIPQPHARLSTTGLAWELHDEVLGMGEREGARNRTAATQVTIDLHDGSFLLVCDARLPRLPIFHTSLTP